MSKKTMYLLLILLTILIGTYFYWKICCNAVCCGDTDTQREVVVPDKDIEQSNNMDGASNSFSWKDGDSSYSTQDNINFDPSGFAILRPISGKVNAGIDELQLYLSGNENKSVDITGLYTSKEDNPSAFPNLGLARANAVKNYLISKGIPSTRMNLNGELNDNLRPVDGIYKGPLTFGISTAAEDTAAKEQSELEALRTKIKANPLVLYFENAQTSISLTAAERQKIADIARYLDKVESARAIVTGHTDNTGGAQGNVNISRKRAEFAKDYLVQNGIDGNRIDALGKGPNEPVASNSTEEGRAQNRRTVVTVN